MAGDFGLPDVRCFMVWSRTVRLSLATQQIVGRERRHHKLTAVSCELARLLRITLSSQCSIHDALNVDDIAGIVLIDITR